jgi:hypothetical protein
LKEEALDRNLWRTHFGRGYGPVVRQTTEWELSGYLSDRHKLCPEHIHVYISVIQMSKFCS